MVLALLDSGSLQDMDAPDLYGRTPLFLAIRFGFIDIVAILLSRGSSAIHTAAHSGYTPFTLVAECKNTNFGDWRDEALQRIWSYINNPEMVPGVSENGVVDSRNRWTIAPGDVYTRPCGVCKLSIPYFEGYLYCGVCEFGTFSICTDCVAGGATCKDSSHALTQIRAGEW
ncbi:hypothetical protein BJY00DRAFT_318050 [Aspergillus carlsbadensis]|nr:hypothetical protein BJY00DRAFT_318050 [Aspergillus carlsbadensis]